jgi:hypothetical protein
MTYGRYCLPDRPSEQETHSEKQDAATWKIRCCTVPG